jgi:uncharacterized protein
MGKEAVRSIARALAIPSADKPASPCLASRLPYGTPVDLLALRRVDSAERALKGLGHRVLRVRHYGDRARIELGSDELARLDPAAAEQATAAVKAAGYSDARIAAVPFRSGSLNEGRSVRSRERQP